MPLYRNGSLICLITFVSLVASTPAAAQSGRVASPAPVRPAPRPAAPEARPAAPAEARVPANIADDIAFLDRFSQAATRVARLARPSVVSIQTLTETARGNERAAGSGVIYDVRGYIVTSYHVVEGATTLTVTLADGREFPARQVGADPPTDCAVIKINAANLTPARFADSSRVEVGQMVLAIGSPFSLAQTVTHGIVSATGRSDLDIDGVDYQSFIQTDASTNPGNSGGALINTHGEVVGINTAIASGSGGFSGVAFATPSNTVLWAAKTLISGRAIVRGYLGVSIRSLSSEVATRLGLANTEGVLIEDVTPNGPAAKAGLRAQDIVLQINGRGVPDDAQFRMIIAETSPGTRAAIVVLRDGEKRSLTATVGELPRKTRRQ